MNELSGAEIFQQLMNKADEHHRLAQWQEKLSILQIALSTCDDSPDGLSKKQQVLYELGGIRRRLGQYEQAEELLEQGLRIFPDIDPLKHANILGELVVVFRHQNKLAESRNASRRQYNLARQAGSSLLAEAEMCRAIGNEGVANLQMGRLMSNPRQRDELLDAAFAQLGERISLADRLIEKLEGDTQSLRLASIVKSWKIIGMDRLSLCHVAAGNFGKALAVAQESQRRQTTNDPTIRAHSRFYYGNALWHAGRKGEAFKQWSAPPGVCNSPIALSKEPSQESIEFLQLMAGAGVDFASFDEQGFSALEYAVLSNTSDGAAMEPVILDAIRNAEYHRLLNEANRSPIVDDIPVQLDAVISRHSRQAELRRQFRTLLQDYIRPLLRDTDKFSFVELRRLFANFMSQNSDDRRALSQFCCVKYSDFKSYGKLPISTSGLASPPSSSTAAGSNLGNEEEAFVIFMSYRWIGGSVPDDSANTQWNRMVSALDQFLEKNPLVQADRLYVWLDYACIDQQDAVEQEHGVNSLPIAVLLCNAMISLVDNFYYTRAWCGVEIMLVRAVMEAYGMHQWSEHVLDSPSTDRVHGALRLPQNHKVLNVAEMKLTKEEEDRPKVDFLMRQSKLLGKSEF